MELQHLQNILHKADEMPLKSFFYYASLQLCSEPVRQATMIHSLIQSNCKFYCTIQNIFKVNKDEHTYNCNSVKWYQWTVSRLFSSYLACIYLYCNCLLLKYKIQILAICTRWLWIKQFLFYIRIKTERGKSWTAYADELFRQFVTN